MNLYHYFDRTTRPFSSLSDVPAAEAEKILDAIRNSKPNSQCAQRHDHYIEYRRNCERILRAEFIKKGGVVSRATPHYLVVEHSPWLSGWYENCGFIKIPIEEFDVGTLSFTYGDSMPTFSPTVNDGKEYRRQLYTYREILKIIDRYGLPQDWNDDGRYGPERYVEVHVWSDETIGKYKALWDPRHAVPL